jgi:cell division protein FtsB
MDLRVNRIAKLRVLPRPEEGLRALVERAPQAEAWAESRIEKLRPWWMMLYRARRRIATAAVAIVTVLLFLHVMFGANGMVVYRQKKLEYEQLQRENESLQQENDRYTEQIHGLKSDPKVIEKEAREKLHYAKPGEVIYVPPPVQATPRPPNKTAKK